MASELRTVQAELALVSRPLYYLLLYTHEPLQPLPGCLNLCPKPSGVLGLASEGEAVSAQITLVRVLC